MWHWFDNYVDWTIGLDWDKLQIFMRGKVRLPLEKGPYSDEERKIMKAVLPELSRMARSYNIERTKLLKKRLDVAIKEKA